MYKVFLMHYYIASYFSWTDEFLLYDSSCINDYDLQIQAPSLTINKEGGSFSFTVPKTHRAWKWFENGTILKRTSQIIIYEDAQWLWEGCIVDYGKDYIGNFKINCDGALQYLKNTTFPLENIVNITKISTETNNAFFIRAFGLFMRKIVTQHNERINDLDTSTVGYSAMEELLRHQKIYFAFKRFNGVDPIIIDSEAVPPDHFSRIVNFETCYDALQKRIVDDFGGFFYLIKELVTVDSELKSQDHTLTIGEQRELLLLRYRMTTDTQDNYTAYLGHNLLDYNISEDFDLATAAIPLGDTYDENHPGDSRWWYKDERSAFHDITQRANYAWRTLEETEGGRIFPTGGSRVFLPSTVDGASDIVAKYGMRDVIVEFDTVVAKYPQIPDWNGNGQAYVAGDLVLYTYTDGGGTVHPHACFIVNRNHTSQPSITPNSTGQTYYSKAPSNHYNTWKYYYSIKHPGQTPPNNPNLINWESKSDYLGDSQDYRIAIYETQTGDLPYRSDYMKALFVLAVDYLTNQQFNKLVLDISATKVSSAEGERFNALRSFGTKIPVSASLFGENLKPYEVTGVTIQLDDDGQSRLTLGGEDTKITKLITTK